MWLDAVAESGENRVYLSHPTEEELQKFWSNLLLRIYYEFVYKQRDQKMWEAGFAVIQQLPVS